MTGAPMFVSHAAMRAGAGIVWCGLPGDDAALRAAGSEVITRALPATPDGTHVRVKDRDALAVVVATLVTREVPVYSAVPRTPTLEDVYFAIEAKFE